MQKKWTKGIIATIFAMIMMLSTVIPTFANEQQTQTPDISPWAVGELNEGEKYGIYPMEWYYDGFRDEISQSRLNDILTQTSDKIARIELEENANHESITVDGTTREDVLNGLYNIVAPYLVEENTPLEYFQERQLILGTGDGLALERPITTEEAAIFATRLVQDTYEQFDAGAKGVAWKVENDGNMVYLLGSIHVGTPDLYPYNSDLLSAFHSSDALYVEANLLDLEGMQYFMEAAMYQDGTTVQDHVSEETYEKLVQVLDMYGLTVEDFEAMKTWSIASDLSNLSLSESLEIPFDQMGSLGIDMYFTTNSLLTQKPILELEGVKAQADMFDGLSEEAQEEYLVDVLDGILNPESLGYNEAEMVNEWFDYWIQGDADSFGTSFSSASAEEPSEFDKMLLGQRDIDMADKIAGLLEAEESATSFVVVGAGHFVTEESILYHLENDGYEVVPFYE